MGILNLSLTEIRVLSALTPTKRRFQPFCEIGYIGETIGYSASACILFLYAYAYSTNATNSDEDPVPSKTKVAGSNIHFHPRF